jgi:hypothetical protein
MGVFSPALEEYDILENKNFRLEISHSETNNISIIPKTLNDTISINSGVISGYYSNVFQNVIKFRTPDYSYNTVTSLYDVPDCCVNLIYEVILDDIEFIEYRYEVYANADYKEYVVTVINDWKFQRNILFKKVNPMLYNQLIVRWKNNLGQSLHWNNINWITENWPWRT